MVIYKKFSEHKITKYFYLRHYNIITRLIIFCLLDYIYFCRLNINNALNTTKVSTMLKDLYTRKLYQNKVGTYLIDLYNLYFLILLD